MIESMDEDSNECWEQWMTTADQCLKYTDEPYQWADVCDALTVFAKFADLRSEYTTRYDIVFDPSDFDIDWDMDWETDW